MELYFRQSGQGQPLIILHGLFGSGDNWASVAKTLAEKYQVFVIDQRNHGRSPHDPEHSYTAMAEDVITFIENQNLKDSYVLGHSMGGKTAMHLALNYPDKIEKLIVADISPRYYKPHHQSVIAGLQSVHLGTLKSRDEADQLMSEHLNDSGERQFLLKNLYRHENGGFAWRMNLDSIAKQIENIGTENTGTPFLKPALFLKGEKSRYIRDSDHEIISGLFPSSKTLTIEGAGHWIHAEKPVEVVQAVVSFLDSAS